MQDFIVEELLSRFNVLLFLESDKDQSLSNIMQCEIPMHFFETFQDAIWNRNLHVSCS